MLVINSDALAVKESIGIACGVGEFNLCGVGRCGVTTAAMC